MMKTDLPKKAAGENENMHSSAMEYQSSGDERYLHMPQSAEFSVDRDFDWLFSGGVKRFFADILHAVVWALLELIDRVWLGVKISGKENPRSVESGAVIICNHVHPMDCTVCVLPTMPRRVYYTTYESNFRIPFIGRLIRALGAVPVCQSPRKLIDMFAAMKKAIDGGAYVVVFPEGELLPYCRELRAFRAGSFRMAVSADAPVVPFALTFRPPRGIWRFKRRPCVTLNILPPIYPDAALPKKRREKELGERCHEAMSAFIDQYYQGGDDGNGGV